MKENWVKRRYDPVSIQLLNYIKFFISATKISTFVANLSALKINIVSLYIIYVRS